MSQKFQSTRWTLVQKLKSDNSAVSRKAFDELCSLYWRPLYGYARRCGKRCEDAEDLVQGFLYQGLEKALFEKADPVRGKMRSFLLSSFRNFMHNEWEKCQAMKRGGEAVFLDFSTEEEMISDGQDPLVEFDKSWGIQLVESARSSIENRYLSEGKGKVFEALSPALEGLLDIKYSVLATQLEMSESSVKVAVHRLKKRFADELQREVEQTLLEGDDVQSELRYLSKVLGGAL